MLTRQRAFKRETVAETMTAILREEPPELSETEWHGPIGLQKILERCLEKSPERRFQSASDLGFAIGALTISSTGAESQTVSVSAARWSWWPWAAGVLGAVAIGLALWLANGGLPSKTVAKFKRLTFQRGFCRTRDSPEAATRLCIVRNGTMVVRYARLPTE